MLRTRGLGARWEQPQKPSCAIVYGLQAIRTESTNCRPAEPTQYDCSQMNRQRWRFWLYAGSALAAGLLLRLWFVAHMANIAGDSLIYGDIAKNLLRHGIYGFTDSRTPHSIGVIPTLIRLPGYPLFLAACFRLFGMEHYRAVLNVQVAADLATCCVAALLAGRLFGKRAGLAVLWLAALCPFAANYVASPLTEPLALMSIALAFYGFARWQDAGRGFNRWLWITSAAVGASVLLRPEQGLFAAAVLPAMLWAALAARDRRGGSLRVALPVLAAALCAVLPLAPWTLRNWHTFHVFQPLAPRFANDPHARRPRGAGRGLRDGDPRDVLALRSNAHDLRVTSCATLCKRSCSWRWQGRARPSWPRAGRGPRRRRPRRRPPASSARDLVQVTRLHKKGDLHVHTNYSFDAYFFNDLNGPREAFAFAKGAASSLPCGDASATPCLSIEARRAARLHRGDRPLRADRGLRQLLRRAGDTLQGPVHLHDHAGSSPAARLRPSPSATPRPSRGSPPPPRSSPAWPTPPTPGDAPWASPTRPTSPAPSPPSRHTSTRGSPTARASTATSSSTAPRSPSRPVSTPRR